MGRKKEKKKKKETISKECWGGDSGQKGKNMCRQLTVGRKLLLHDEYI